MYASKHIFMHSSIDYLKYLLQFFSRLVHFMAVCTCILWQFTSNVIIGFLLFIVLIFCDVIDSATHHTDVCTESGSSFLPWIKLPQLYLWTLPFDIKLGF